jgi:hypothetical protein
LAASSRTILAAFMVGILISSTFLVVPSLWSAPPAQTQNPDIQEPEDRPGTPQDIQTLLLDFVPRHRIYLAVYAGDSSDCKSPCLMADITTNINLLAESCKDIPASELKSKPFYNPAVNEPLLSAYTEMCVLIDDALRTLGPARDSQEWRAITAEAVRVLDIGLAGEITATPTVPATSTVASTTPSPATPLPSSTPTVPPTMNP